MQNKTQAFHQMSKAVVGRLDKIENEIRLLLQIQKTKNPHHRHSQNDNKNGDDLNYSIQQEHQFHTNIETTSTHSSSNNRKIQYGENIKLKDKGDTSFVINFPSNETVHPCKIRQCSENICDINCFIIKIQNLQKFLRDEKENTKALHQEILRLEESINQLRQTKEEAQKISKEWREKYMTLKNCKCSTKLYNQVVNEKTALNNALIEEHDKLAQATEELKRCRRLLHNKQTATESTKELMKSLGEKNETITNLEKKLINTEHCNRELHNQCDDLNNSLSILKENLKTLQHTNQQLATDMINKCNCFKAATDKIEIQLNSFKETKAELEYLKKKCNNHARICKEKDKMNKSLSHEVNKLGEELDSLKNREGSFENTIVVLENKLKALNKDHLELGRISKNNLKKLKEENVVLVGKVTEYSDKLKNEELYWMEKYNCLKCEFNSYKDVLEEKEKMGQLENKELKAVVEEMTRILKEQKQKINKIIDLNIKHEEKIKRQNCDLCCKEEQLVAAKQEISRIKVYYNDLEERCRQLKGAGDGNRIDQLENAIATLGKMVQAEQDKLLIKEKMLEDQSDTIKSLKRSLSEKENDVQGLNLKLQNWKKEKSEINVKILAIEHKNRSLIHHNNELENDMAMQDNLMKNLEKNFLLKESEWDLQIKVLEKEKEAAKKAAAFAKEKLLQTTQDFENHIKTQNRTRNALASLLKEKDDKLKGVIAQMSSLTLDHGACLQTLNLSPQRVSTGNRSHLSSNHSTFSYSDESFT